MAKVLPRSHSRAAAVQALYQALVNGHDPAIDDGLEFITAESSNKIDKKYFAVLVEGVGKEREKLDAELAFAIDRDLSEIDPVECSILRLAVYEFMYCPEIPYRVILNEAVELAKSFGGEKGHKYVNGVLDKVGYKLRMPEYKSSRQGRSNNK